MLGIRPLGSVVLPPAGEWERFIAPFYFFARDSSPTHGSSRPGSCSVWHTFGAGRGRTWPYANVGSDSAAMDALSRRRIKLARAATGGARRGASSAAREGVGRSGTIYGGGSAGARSGSQRTPRFLGLAAPRMCCKCMPTQTVYITHISLIVNVVIVVLGHSKTSLWR